MTINADKIYVLEKIEFIDLPDPGDFASLVSVLNGYLALINFKEFTGEWKDITYEWSHSYDYDILDGIQLWGYRLETNSEQSKRLAKLQRAEKRKQELALGKKAAQETREYNQYLKLKKKFEKENI